MRLASLKYHRELQDYRITEAAHPVEFAYANFNARATKRLYHTPTRVAAKVFEFSPSDVQENPSARFPHSHASATLDLVGGSVGSLTSAEVLEAWSKASRSSLAFACSISPTSSFKLSTYCFLRIRVLRACSRFRSRLPMVAPWEGREATIQAGASFAGHEVFLLAGVKLRFGMNS